MKTFQVVIDTCIYRADAQRKGLPFQALRKLCESGIACLHLPYVVEREFQTHQAQICRQDLAAARKALSKILRRGLPAPQAAVLEGIHSKLEEESHSIQGAAEREFTDWASTLGATRHGLTREQSVSALEAYFEGNLPLKEPKNRKDIPDSFIYQQILDLHSTHGTLVVIVEDGKLVEAVSKLDGAKVFLSLKEFIDSDEIQAGLREFEVLSDLETVARKLREFENTHKTLSQFVKESEGESLDGYTFSDPSIPDDNHEATVSCYGLVSEVIFDFDEMHFYGDSRFGLPVSFRCNDVLATYYILKADYYMLAGEGLPGVTDHNDHYFEAEEHFSLRAKAMLDVHIDLEKFSEPDPLPAAAVKAEAIDSIEEVEVVK